MIRKLFGCCLCLCVALASTNVLARGGGSHSSGHSSSKSGASHSSAHSTSKSNTSYGGKHTASHDGKFVGGQGSSHRGGTYKNPKTNDHFVKHKYLFFVCFVGTPAHGVPGLRQVFFSQSAFF